MPRQRLPVMVFLLARGADDQCLAFDPVPEVAARIPHRSIGLHVALSVSGPHGDHMLARSGRSPDVLPGSEGMWTVIRASVAATQFRPSSSESSTFMTGPSPLKAMPCTRTGNPDGSLLLPSGTTMKDRTGMRTWPMGTVLSVPLAASAGVVLPFGVSGMR